MITEPDIKVFVCLQVNDSRTISSSSPTEVNDRLHKKLTIENEI